MRSEIQKARETFQEAKRGSEVLEILERAQTLWAEDLIWKEKLKECFERFSGEVKEQDLESFLDPKTWQTKVERELGSLQALDEVSEGIRTPYEVAYRPWGVLLHFCPGNSWMGGVESLLYGILSGNQNLIKLSKNTPQVAKVLVELLKEAGLPEFQVQFVDWNSTHEALLSEVDGVVVWGGEGVLSHLKPLVPTGVRWIEFGPKLSFSVLTEKALESFSLEGLAKDFCRFDQKSCSSSQFLLLETSDEKKSKALFFQKMKEALKSYQKIDPPGKKSAHEQMEVLKALESSRLKKLQDKGDFESGYPDWLLIWENGAIEASPLYRVLRVYPVSSQKELRNRLKPLRHYLQTASVSALPSEWPPLREALWEEGVHRVVEAGRSTEEMNGAPHDGQWIFRQMTRVVSEERSEKKISAQFKKTESSLSRILKEARKASFYRERISEEPFSWEAFWKIPSLKKEDFHRFGPPESEALLTRSLSFEEGAYLFTTGGTTSAPTYAVYTRSEWERVTDLLARQYQEAGITDKDRVVNLFSGGGLWSAYQAVDQALRKIGAMVIPMGSHDSPEQRVKWLKKIPVTALVGLPSVLLETAQKIEGSLPLQTILYAGERLTPERRAFLEKTFQTKQIFSAGYASVDAGPIGHQCVKSEGSIHHLFDSDVFLEIVDPETGKPVRPGEEGEVWVTSYFRKWLPVIRLRTGDRGKLVLGECPCGLSSFRFELLGRSDQRVRVAGADLHLSDVEKTSQSHPRLNGVYQVQIEKARDLLEDQVTVYLETKGLPSEPFPEEARSHVMGVLLNYAEEVRTYQEQGKLKHFKVEFVPPGWIPRNPRTGKWVSLWDRRDL